MRHTFHRSLYLSAISIDPRNPNLFAVGGSDTFARVYDIRKCKWDGSSEFGQPVNFFCPSHLVNENSVGITGLAYSSQSELLVSYNDELIYLFTKDIGFGPNFRGSRFSSVEGDIEAAPQSYKGHSNSGTVKGVNFLGPKCEYVVTGSDCGQIFIWNKKGGKVVRVIEADGFDVNCLDTHPHATVLASSGVENGIKMWTPKATGNSIQSTNIDKVCLCFDKTFTVLSFNCCECILVFSFFPYLLNLANLCVGILKVILPVAETEYNFLIC